MIDYDGEAARYDATRGGEPRAAAAAAAVERLMPDTARVVVDLGCGSGIVTRRLRGRRRLVVGVDRSAGMLRLASARLPGHAVRGDVTRLPVAPASVDVVTAIWVLHLLPDAGPVLAEAARTLRGDGVLITTVDKEQAPYRVPSDIADVSAALRRDTALQATDHLDRILRAAAGHGLGVVGETDFVGVGQGGSPRRWSDSVAAGHVSWCRTADPARVADLHSALLSLPDQETARPDPVYRLIALGFR